MFQVISLRKLTLKSKLCFGKYSEETVEHLISRKGFKAKDYLRWCYFNLSKISFTDEVLINDLKIRKEDLIKKPGKKDSDKIRDKYYKKLTPNNGFLSADVMQKGSSYRVGIKVNAKAYNRSFNQNK